MPLFAFHCLDKQPEGKAIREANRPDHLQWVVGLGDIVRFGGALFSEDGETMIGSLLLVECDNLAAAHALAEQDPYAKAGLFERVDIHQTVWGIGDGKPG